MRKKSNLITMHEFNLNDLREHITFDGYNFYDLLRVLKRILKEIKNCTLLKDLFLKNLTSPIYLSIMIAGNNAIILKIICSVIPNLWEELEGLETFYMLRQVGQISQRYRATWFETDQTRKE